MLFLPTGIQFVQAQASVGAYDLINLVNGMRSANGLGSLAVDSALMACAQATAETMAASHMTWHIGNVSGRASSFGYNNYNECFATENFMMGSASMTLSQIQAGWADASHMIPMQSSSYCHIGAGVAAGDDGFYYFVLQAAYPKGKAGCGYATTVGSYASASADGGVSMLVKPVVTSTPDQSGYVFHTVEDGQTLWAISAAYDVTIADIQSWNNMHGSTALSLGEKLYIPAKSQSGTTPTPYLELTVLPTADGDGRFYHEVKEGDTFWSISEVWNVPINRIYEANGMTENDTIGLGWRISIPVTATPTLPPTETPTSTPAPTEIVITETPVPEEAASPTAVPDQSPILHMPVASSRTYIISGAVLVLLAAGIAAGILLAKRKK